MVTNVRIVGRGDPDLNQPARVDEDAGALVTVDAIHNWIHLGRFFSFDAVDRSLANGAFLDVRIDVVGGCHLRVLGGAGADSWLTLHDSDGNVTGGTEVTPVQRNRFSSNTPATRLFTGPTVTTPGTTLSEMFMPGGSGFLTTGGDGSFFEEYILNPGTYLARLENASGLGAQPAFVQLDFYEPEISD